MATSTSSANHDSSSPSSSGYHTPFDGLGLDGRFSSHCLRRPTKPASYELTNHAKAYLDGGQFASGYDFLYSLLAPGASISTPSKLYLGFLAPPAYIGLASSLVAYPPSTTQTISREAIKGSDAALRYLRCVQETIDNPAYPAVRKALAFPEERNRRRAPGNRSAAGSPSPDSDGNVERIAGSAANEKCLWYCAEDFWHIVGWAFNCSIIHRKRWARWKLWLSTILDFLEADWDVCMEQRTVEPAKGEDLLRDSLLWRYIVGQAETTNRAMRRRMIKAILAMATPESLKDYPEVWENETKEPKQKKSSKRPVGNVDFETGDIGDYQSDEEMQDESEEQDEADEDLPSPSGSSEDGMQNVLDAVDRLGEEEAIELRHRLLALLAQVALALPTQFTTLSDFMDNVLEDFIQLPVLVFQVLVSTLQMPGMSQVAFCANLLLPLVSGTLPAFLYEKPTQHHLETILLPLKGANQSFAANAKISLLLEQIFLQVMSRGTLTSTPSLRSATENGIKARQSVYGIAKGKKGNAEEEEQGEKVMKSTSERLLGLLEVLEITAGKLPQQPERGRKANTVPVFLSFTSGSSLSPPPSSDTEAEE